MNVSMDLQRTRAVVRFGEAAQLAITLEDENEGDEERFGDFELSASPKGGADFVRDVAAQLGYEVSTTPGKAEAPEVLLGSVVVFAYEPGRLLHTKLGIEDPNTDEQLELYFDVEGGTATFGSKAPEETPELLSLLARALSGNRVPRVSKKTFRFASFADVLAAAEKNSEASFAALHEGLVAQRSLFLACAPSLIRTLETTRANQTDTRRAALLSNLRWLLVSLERPEGLVAFADSLRDADARVRRDALISLEALAARPSAAAFLHASAERARLVAALDTYLVKFLMVDPEGLQKCAVRARTLLAA